MGRVRLDCWILDQRALVVIRVGRILRFALASSPPRSKAKILTSALPRILDIRGMSGFDPLRTFRTHEMSASCEG